ncbi:MAG: rRNA (adenine2503-C2)-methyltransferase [Clostridia bacterium]|nr:rRNA (adenine2503-C2)-methyltransferase [Clostridia bacterium]MDN5322250.1 rRNA (adenine2503-C2)-methyltransferase [Clostridia bacterium]
MMKKDLRSMNLHDMEQLMQSFKQPTFRAKQLFDWIHNKAVTDFYEMTNLGNQLLERLVKETEISTLQFIKKQVSKDGTTKYLFTLKDNNYIECVLMPYRGTKSKQRNTLCVSSQVGCAMGCGFCATGQGGFKRNLTTGEIVSQIYTVNNNDQLRVGNVVFMGMGEPLLNFANVINSIRLLNDSHGQNISMRRITISTCGIVPKIIDLANLNLDIVLAISLHAPIDKLRSQIMPVNKQYPLNKLKEACLYYVEKTKRRVTFEYALVDNFNDNKKHAGQLAKFLEGIFCHVNLIPVNPIGQLSYKRPDKAKIYTFLKELSNHGIEASIREEKGADIDAACGQLRGKVVE